MRSSRGILDSSGRDASGGKVGRRSRSADYRAAFGSAFRVVSPSSLAAGRRRTKGRPGEMREDPPEMFDAAPHAPAYTTAGDPPVAGEGDEADRPDREGAAVVSDDEDDDGSDADFDEIARPWKDGTWDGPPGARAEPAAGLGRRHRLGVGEGHRLGVGRGR
ncbi:hypothetical protein THAOC_37302, partial [Thalassiosira oceanica]